MKEQNCIVMVNILWKIVLLVADILAINGVSSQALRVGSHIRTADCNAKNFLIYNCSFRIRLVNPNWT